MAKKAAPPKMPMHDMGDGKMMPGARHPMPGMPKGMPMKGGKKGK